MEKNNGYYETINSESIKKGLNNLETQSENGVALGMLHSTQNRINNGLKELIEEGKIPEIKFALKYNKEKGTYRIISGNYILKLDLKLKGLKEKNINKLTSLSYDLGLEGVLFVLEKLYLAKGSIFDDNINTIKLTGKKDFRKIIENNFLSDKNKKIINKSLNPFLNKNRLREINNETEEIFKFVMNTKGIPIEKWNVDSICEKGDNKCKASLGVPENKNEDLIYAEK